MPRIADPRRAQLVPVPGSTPASASSTSTVPLPAGRATTIVVVDPIPLFVEGLRSALSRTPSVRVLSATANPQVALALCQRARPDVVMIDALSDPRCQFARLLAGECGKSPAPAVLSVLREPLRNTRYLTAAAGSGVTGFVLRSAEAARMIEAIRRTHLQHRFLDPELSALAGGPPLRAFTPVSSAATRQPLSPREQEVLRLIADGMENQEIATTLFVSVETIRTHVKSILRKLHARDRAHAVALSFRLGLLAPLMGDGADSRGRAGEADGRTSERITTITARSGREHVQAPSLARVTSR